MKSILKFLLIGLFIKALVSLRENESAEKENSNLYRRDSVDPAIQVEHQFIRSIEDISQTLQKTLELSDDKRIGIIQALTQSIGDLEEKFDKLRLI